MKNLHYRRIWAVMLRHLFAFPRDMNNLVDTFWWGTFDLVIWGYTSRYFQGQTGGGSFLQLLIGGLILWMVVSRMQQEIGIAYIKEAWDRNMMNITSSPLTMEEHMAALVFMGVVKLALTTAWMAFLAYILFSFNIFRLGFALLPFTANLLLVGLWAALFINSLIIQYGYRIESLTWMLIWLIQPFSGVFYPLSALPSWMETIGRMLPTSYIFDGMRQVLSTGKLDTGLLGMSFALNVVYLILAMSYFRYGYRKALETGMILKLG